MTAPVKQTVSDHVPSEVDPECAHPDLYLADVDWATAFEFGGAW